MPERVQLIPAHLGCSKTSVARRSQLDKPREKEDEQRTLQCRCSYSACVFDAHRPATRPDVRWWNVSRQGSWLGDGNAPNAAKPRTSDNSHTWLPAGRSIQLSIPERFAAASTASFFFPQLTERKKNRLIQNPWAAFFLNLFVLGVKHEAAHEVKNTSASCPRYRVRRESWNLRLRDQQNATSAGETCVTPSFHSKCLSHKVATMTNSTSHRPLVPLSWISQDKLDTIS